MMQFESISQYVHLQVIDPWLLHLQAAVLRGQCIVLRIATGGHVSIIRSDDDA
jgi:hypothetical protein